MDCRHFSERELEFLVKDRLFVDGAAYPEYFEQRGLDLRKDLMEFEVGELKGGGFLLVNEQLESTLDGLFGFTPSGLPNALCAGFSAGSEAGKQAQRVRGLAEIDVDLVAREKRRVLAPLQRDSGYSSKELEDAIRQVMNYYVSYIRNQKGMEVALHSLRLIEKHTDGIKADNYHELLRAHEAIHLVRYCQLLVTACRERTESGRSFYKRSDYPDLDEAWARKWIVQWQEQGKPRISVVPIG